MEGLEQKPLYCFKLNEETGEIKRYEIADWDLCGFPHRKYYAFRVDFGSGVRRYECRAKNLNEFTNGKMYSFNPSIKEAYTVIYAAIQEKIEEAKRVESRWNLAQANMFTWRILNNGKD